MNVHAGGVVDRGNEKHAIDLLAGVTKATFYTKQKQN